MSHASETTEAAIRAACLLEVTARKPGNVHPLAAFADCDWETFAASADAIAPVLAGAASRPLGETILLAVEATRQRVGRNTNLGMILLLAPLAAAPAGEGLRRGVAGVLAATTVEDCRLVYQAIRLARPGGLGTAEREDVSAAPTIGLIDAMRLAADRDAVARQFVNGFADVLRLSERFDADVLPDVECQIVTAHVERLAQEPDTLILRKCGPEVAAEASRLSAAALAAGGIDTEAGQTRLTELDAYLRADGNRRNPGTTADLIAAALFVAIREDRVPCFDAQAITTYANELVASKPKPWLRR